MAVVTITDARKRKLYCGVKQCKAYSGLEIDGRKISFHRIPKERKKRRRWLRAMKDHLKKDNPGESTRICSQHFPSLSGPKSWCPIPTILPKENTLEEKTTKGNTKPPAKRKRVEDHVFDECCNITDINVNFHDYIHFSTHPSSIYNSPSVKPKITRSQSTQTTVLETREIGTDTKLPEVTIEDLKEDDKKVKFYTGIINFGTMMLIFNTVSKGAQKLNYWRGKDSLKEKRYLQNVTSKKPGPVRKMRLKDEFVMVMMRLRLGLLVEDLAQRFYVSTSTVSRVLITWYGFLAAYFKHLIYWPSKEEIKLNLPISFLKYPNTRIILDCTEFLIEKPSSLINQALTYSSYKSHNTFKLLVGISPTGSVTFLSKLWGGHVSDNHIVKKCGLLDLLEPGDSIMADKGFDIAPILKDHGCTLNVPPKRESSKKQMSRKQVEETRRIASVRIHVERKMEQIKNFRILQGVIPSSEWHHANNIVLICAALTNLEPPLAK